jgi:selenocysteine-specific elongation factor
MLIGAAGHVDHGKSSLVEALTGVNPMRLPEELRRELTIELGFASLQHPDGYTLGIVDVPGHEKLVRTMIAGASGFEIALWVVDAREGLMPQSFEHLDVLRLLGVRCVIPVITKAAIATEKEIAATTEAVARLVETPAVVVDSQTGLGIPRLLETIFEACRSFTADERRAEAAPYMPIDRCFVLKGVGVVVTGTLVRGVLNEGDHVSISGRPESYRIRSLHNHHSMVARIGPGNRVGAHLHGVQAQEVQRGDVLVPPGYLHRSSRVNAQIQFLEGARFAWKPGLRAHFLAASFEMECRVWGLARSSTGAWAQIELPREACFYEGQRFILRSTNPLTTIGGGTIVDIAPDRPRRVTEAERDRARYLEVSAPAVFDRVALAKKWMRDPADLVTNEVRMTGELLWHRKLDALALARLNEWIAQAGDRVVEWPFVRLAAAFQIKPEYVGRYLESFLGENFKGVLTLTSSSLRYDPRRGDLSEAEERLAAELVQKLRAAGIQPLRLAEYCAGSPAERKVFEKVAGRLVREGRLFRVDNEFVLESAVWSGFKEQVRAAAVDGFTASEFGKRFGLSRKYSVPYLECLNRSGILRRQGDRHLIVRAPSNVRDR